MSGWRNELNLTLKYIIAGSLNTVFGLGVIYSLMLCGVFPLIANIAGYTLGFILSFCLQKYYVFTKKSNGYKQGINYIISFVLSYLINIFVYYLSTSFLHIDKYISQFLGAIAFTFFMFVFSRLFVFR